MKNSIKNLQVNHTWQSSLSFCSSLAISPLSERNRKIIEEKENEILPVNKVQNPILMKHKEKPKTLPKPRPIKEKPKTLPKPKVPPKVREIQITYEESDLGSEV